jgi:hypothetical protein
MAAAQLINITVQELNGNALSNTPHILFPTQGILCTQLTTPKVVNGTSCVSQIKVLATNELYLTGTTIADIATAANGA